MKVVSRKVSSLIIVAGCVTAAFGSDWRQFRGPQGGAVALDATLPTKLDAQQHVTWRADLPGRGHSSAIIVGERVFVTCASGTKPGRLHVICLDANTGKNLWERQFWATGRTTTHEKISCAGPTPASDGQRIFALFSSNDLFCLDLEGNLLWLRGLMRDYPNASSALGLSASPAVADETFVAQIETDSDAFAIGVDAQTGRNRWKIGRPRHVNWSSPLVLEGANGTHSLLLQSATEFRLTDAASGREVWTWRERGATVPSSALEGNRLYAACNGITALDISETAAAPKELWRAPSLKPPTASPIALGQRLYVLNEASILTSAEVQAGKRLWQLRLKGPFTASPVATARYIYLVNEKGLVQVVDPLKNEGEVVGELDLNDTIIGTPSIAGDALYIRSDKHLWKISNGKLITRAPSRKETAVQLATASEPRK